MNAFCDPDQIRKWFKIFKSEGEMTEIRVIYSDGRKPRTNLFKSDKISEIVNFVKSRPDDSRPFNVYWTLNTIKRDVSEAVQDDDISFRKWLLIDLDPCRPAHSSSTSEEKEKAWKTAFEILDDTCLDFPDPVICDSGNGYHLYYRLDCENTKETDQIIDNFVKTLSVRFSSSDVSVDTSVTNPSRISKMPGTLAVKGTNTPERPHRMSEILKIPETIEVLSIDQMKQYMTDHSVDLGAIGLDESSETKDKDIHDEDFDTEVKVRQYVEAFEKFLDNGGDPHYMEDDMVKIGYALSRGGKDYEEYFHRIFYKHPMYDRDFSHREFSRLLGKANSIGIGTFFHWCQSRGIIPDSEMISSGFPFDVFPEDVQAFINKAHESRLKFPKVYTACGALCAVSCAIGNTYSVEFTRGHSENAVIYLAVVGGKGKNKSHPLSMALQPLTDQDANFRKVYKSLLSDYMDDKDKPKKERIGIPRPSLQQFIVRDVTAEALAMVMEANPRGILLFADELIGWIKAQNQYRSGNGADAEMWLSLWSGKSHSVTRKTSESYHIEKPFVSVCGTIQPSIIPTMAENREANGFLDRILFAWPQDVKMEAFSEDDPEMDEEIIDTWTKVIERISSVVYADRSKPLHLSPDANRLYIEWQKTEVEKCNRLDQEKIRKTDDVPYNGIHAKMESYVLRFSLILEILYRATDEPERYGDEISSRSMRGAIRLCQYFTDQAMTIRSLILASDLDRLSDDKRQLYASLPDDFTTAEGVEKANQAGIPERTFKRMLRDRALFKKTEYGKYEKNYK